MPKLRLVGQINLADISPYSLDNPLPQEREAIQSLAVLEAGVKSCGPVFHAEVGKFKFLNEMIKLVSPKYLVSTFS